MKIVFKLVAMLLFVFAGNASASFTGAYDFTNWTKVVNGGSIMTSTNLDSLTMVSSNNGGGSRNQDFTITAVATGLVSFSWDYLTFDSSKNQAPKSDPFGWLLNGSFTQLTDNKGFFFQNGLFSFAVNVGDVFGFRSASTNSRNGAAISLVTNFSGPVSAPTPPAAVPLPSAIWLMAAPLILAALNKREKRVV